MPAGVRNEKTLEKKKNDDDVAYDYSAMTYRTPYTTSNIQCYVMRRNVRSGTLCRRGDHEGVLRPCPVKTNWPWCEDKTRRDVSLRSCTATRPPAVRMVWYDFLSATTVDGRHGKIRENLLDDHRDRSNVMVSSSSVGSSPRATICCIF